MAPRTLLDGGEMVRLLMLFDSENENESDFLVCLQKEADTYSIGTVRSNQIPQNEMLKKKKWGQKQWRWWDSGGSHGAARTGSWNFGPFSKSALNST